MFAVAVGIFVWWRGGVLHTLPTMAPTFSTSTLTLPPLTAERGTLLKFEEENLAAKAKQLGVRSSVGTDAGSATPAPAPQKVTSTSALAAPRAAATTSVSSPPPAQSTPASSNTPADAVPATLSSSVPAMPTTTTPTSTPTASAATGTPIFIPPSAATSAPPTYHVATRQFLVDGKGFCNYAANSSVVLTGYPLVIDATVQGSDIKNWTDDRVVFWVPDSVPSGVYRVIVRGVNGWGYCTASTSSPQTIRVQ